MNRICILISFLVFISCNSGHKEEPTEKTPIYSSKIIPCTWGDQIVFDSIFPGNNHLTIRTSCMDDINYTDTSTANKDTFEIHQWRDIKLIINSTLFGEVQFKKANIGDSLATDLRTNGFLVPPYDVSYNQQDSSVSFKSFIGYAESDVGDTYIIKLDARGRVTILGREAPTDGD